MRSNPPKGMRDIGADETEIRSAVLSKILSHYGNAGFSRITTPVMEDSENISKSEGGENLALVFEVLKRGDKLKAAMEAGEPLSDLALRYDLTLPLSRFFAANRAALPTPFRVIQAGSVFRAERPQKGRLREFVQCDIDIIGDVGRNAEIELFSTTLSALGMLGFGDLRLLVSDRRILRGAYASAGFAEKDFESVSVTADKMDKIGSDGVRNELLEKGFPEKSVRSLCAFLETSGDAALGSAADSEVACGLREMIATLRKVIPSGCSVEFSPSLVRGQGYYTGTVAEVCYGESRTAIAGGGRYDGMIGKFIGESVPAVGISIGFERIMNIILDGGMKVAELPDRIALVYSQSDDFAAVLAKKAELMKSGASVSVYREPKNRKAFWGMLQNAGVKSVVSFADGSVKSLTGQEG